MRAQRLAKAVVSCCSNNLLTGRFSNYLSIVTLSPKTGNVYLCVNTSFIATCTSTTTTQFLQWRLSAAKISDAAGFNPGIVMNQILGDFLLVLVSQSPYYVYMATLINVEFGHNGTTLSCTGSLSALQNESARIILLVQGTSLIHMQHTRMLLIIPHASPA